MTVRLHLCGILLFAGVHLFTVDSSPGMDTDKVVPHGSDDAPMEPADNEDLGNGAKPDSAGIKTVDEAELDNRHEGTSRTNTLALPNNWTKLANQLDIISRDIETWGYCTVSEILLLPDTPIPERNNMGYFHVDASSNYSFFAERARSSIQAKSQASDQQQMGFALSGRLGMDEYKKKVGKLAEKNVEYQTQSLEQNAAILAALQQAQLERIELQNELYQLQAEHDRELLKLSLEQKLATLKESTDALKSALGTNVFFLIPGNTDLATTNPFASYTLIDMSQFESNGFVVSAPSSQLATILSNLIVSNRFHHDLSPLNQNSNQFGISVSEGDVLSLGASHTIKSRLIEFMSHPVQLSGDELIYMGIAQVSVMPGRKTSEGYIGEVTLHFEYTDGDAFVPKNVHPTVLSAFPLVDGQLMDQGSMRSRQVALLLELAVQYQAAGMGSEANAAYQYAKQMDAYAASRNILPVVVPASAKSSVTYRFNPAFFARTDAGDNKHNAGSVLHATSFPILLVMVVNAGELQAFHNRPRLHMHTTTRWTAIETPPHKKGLFRKNTSPSSPTVSQRIEHAFALGEIGKALVSNDSSSNRNEEAFFEFYRLYNESRTKALGSTFSKPLPQPFPRLDELIVMAADRNQDSVSLRFHLSGAHLLRDQLRTVVFGDDPVPVFDATHTSDDQPGQGASDTRQRITFSELYDIQDHQDLLQPLTRDDGSLISGDLGRTPSSTDMGQGSSSNRHSGSTKQEPNTQSDNSWKSLASHHQWSWSVPHELLTNWIHQTNALVELNNGAKIPVMVRWMVPDRLLKQPEPPPKHTHLAILPSELTSPAQTILYLDGSGAFDEDDILIVDGRLMRHEKSNARETNVFLNVGGSGALLRFDPAPSWPDPGIQRTVTVLRISSTQPGYETGRLVLSAQKTATNRPPSHSNQVK